MNTKQLEKKEAILEATLQLITENGFHATPMSQIAKAAGVAAGTIYLYFKNKEELINELYRVLKARLGKAMSQGVSPEIPVRIAFEKFWYNVLYYQLKNPLAFRFLEQYANSPFIMQSTLEEGMKSFLPLMELVKLAKQEKMIKDLPEYVLFAFLHAPISFLIKMQLQGKLTLDENTIAQTFQGCWDAIKN